MIVGILLYYALAIEKTLLPVLGDISPEQSKSTKNIYSKVLQFLNYICTHPLAIIEYHSSEIILHVSSYASYNLVSKGRSRASGVHYLSDNHPPPPPQSIFKTYNPKMNGLIYILCKIMKNIVAYAAEAEFGTIFLNIQEAVPIRTTLEEIKCPQPPTPVQIDNSTATVIANRQIKKKCQRHLT